MAASLPLVNKLEHLAETLVVYYLAFAQEAQGLGNERVVGKLDQVLVGGAGLLLRRHILVQVAAEKAA